jgi:hypothetical protein
MDSNTRCSHSYLSYAIGVRLSNTKEINACSRGDITLDLLDREQCRALPDSTMINLVIKVEANSCKVINIMDIIMGGEIIILLLSAECGRPLISINDGDLLPMSTLFIDNKSNESYIETQSVDINSITIKNTNDQALSVKLLIINKNL